MRRTLFEERIVESVVRLIRGVDRHPVVVGIDGQGGAGKSTFAAQLARQLDKSCIVIHGDDFYRDMPDYDRLLLDPAQGVDQYFDWQRLRRQVLDVVRATEPLLRYQRYDWDSAAMAEWVEESMPDVLILEGVYTLRAELLDAIDVKVYVHATEEVRLQRQVDRGENSDEWIQRWVAAEDHYVSSYDPPSKADIVVHSF